LGELAGALDDALEAEFEPERRAFRPHLTVARSDPPIPLPASFAETDLASDAFPIDRVVLFRSHLRRPAPRYEPLAEFPLSGA
jgi:2'-5' RNA ligase